MGRRKPEISISSIIQSLNSPFFPPHIAIGVEPGRAKRESIFAHPGSAPICCGKKGEFRDWTRSSTALLFSDLFPFSASHFQLLFKSPLVSIINEMKKFKAAIWPWPWSSENVNCFVFCRPSAA